MDNKTQIIKHLEMIQGVINRLASNSFSIKGWSIVISSSIIFVTTKNNITADSKYIYFLFVPIIFCILDMYFLWQERLFRTLYNDIRKQETTDFRMNALKYSKNCKYYDLSSTIIIFYGIHLLILIL